MSNDVLLFYTLGYLQVIMFSCHFMVADDVRASIVTYVSRKCIYSKKTINEEVFDVSCQLIETDKEHENTVSCYLLTLPHEAEML